ncbi:MAG: oligosaccharide flippase family protein [Novosphingobium sp.]|nr:oligosaccharide flippase family protein [Novosphingobium sp.]
MTAQISALATNLRQLIVPRIALAGAAGWVTTAFGFQQVMRLGANVVLAWLLAPHLLGTMLLINTLRTGGELLTDVGVGQSIVNHPKGAEPSFYNTAWTIQIIRGLLLFVVALAATVPLAGLYENPQLKILLPVAAFMFIIGGFISPARFILIKRMEIRKLALFDTGAAAFSNVVTIALAFYSPTIWALLGGLLIGTAVPALATFFLIDWRSHAIRWNREAASAILHFGKWIFASSFVYFGAMSFDRLYLADVVPLAILGVYGIARTLADALTQLFQRLGGAIIFPKISSSAMEPAALRQTVVPLRGFLILVLAVGLGCAVVLADAFIFLAYDDRYRTAGIFLTILLVGTWFSILSVLADAMMMGIGKPSSVAAANAVKFLLILIAVPLIFPRAGIIAAVGLFALSEAARYAVLVWRKRAVGLSFLRQDIGATLLFFMTILVVREFTDLLGITGGLYSWVAQAEAVVG